MSTNAMAFKQNEDGSSVGIYIHWDGCVDHTGRTLVTYYSDETQVDALIALGDLSQIGASPEAPPGHSFNSPAPGHCVSYHRDRGESWLTVKPRNLPSSNRVATFDVPYVYLWTKVFGWRCIGSNGKRKDIAIP